MPFSGEYGIEDVSLSLPSVIGREGVLKRVPLPLPAEEEEALRKSAESVKAVLRGNGVIA